MTEETKKATCETCPFFKKSAVHLAGYVDGLCKLHGPTATTDPTNNGRWPRVEPADWCGEHPGRAIVETVTRLYTPPDPPDDHFLKPDPITEPMRDAAPAMFAALDGLIDRFEAVAHNVLPPDLIEADPALKTARAALKQARGES